LTIETTVWLLLKIVSQILRRPVPDHGHSGTLLTAEVTHHG